MANDQRGDGHHQQAPADEAGVNSHAAANSSNAAPAAEAVAATPDSGDSTDTQGAPTPAQDTTRQSVPSEQNQVLLQPHPNGASQPQQAQQKAVGQGSSSDAALQQLLLLPHNQVPFPPQQQQAAVAASHGQQDGMQVDTAVQDGGVQQQMQMQQLAVLVRMRQQVVASALQDMYERQWDQQQTFHQLQVALRTLQMRPWDASLLRLVLRLYGELEAWGTYVDFNEL